LGEKTKKNRGGWLPNHSFIRTAANNASTFVPCGHEKKTLFHSDLSKACIDPLADTLSQCKPSRMLNKLISCVYTLMMSDFFNRSCV